MSLAKPNEARKLVSLARAFHTSSSRDDAAGAALEYKQFPYWLQPRYKIGKREVVACGLTCNFDYNDRKDWPFPNVRWSEPCNQWTALQEKEKGDWSKMTIEEKKALYRFSYRQNFAEMDAPTGDWKLYISSVLLAMGTVAWMLLFTRVYICNLPLPETLSEESMRDQLEKMINLHNGPVEGVSSLWDYEKGMWKKDVK